ncbi:MAG: 4Fe-4S binding protein [Raoultibacter sp.]
MYAVRNIRLCTKDCLCLYVCPTGAADTENSIIDRDKCSGCGSCAAACPSGAISMVPETYPPQQPKDDAVVSAQRALARSKTIQENKAATIAATAENDTSYRLAKAVEMSNRIMAEDILREAGYMLPQCGNTHTFLRLLQESSFADDFPKEAVAELLSLITPNE